MRWENLTDRAEHSRAEHSRAGAAPSGADAVISRSSGPPGFRGITLPGIRARSALDRVPGASRRPFAWTLTPCRGRSRARA